MHSVVETPSFLADAKEVEMDDDERGAVVSHLAANPTAGDIMRGGWPNSDTAISGIPA
jgi:hypothetical protein